MLLNKTLAAVKTRQAKEDIGWSDIEDEEGRGQDNGEENGSDSEEDDSSADYDSVSDMTSENGDPTSDCHRHRKSSNNSVSSFNTSKSNRSNQRGPLHKKAGSAQTMNEKGEINRHADRASPSPGRNQAQAKREAAKSAHLTSIHDAQGSGDEVMPIFAGEFGGSGEVAAGRQEDPYSATAETQPLFSVRGFVGGAAERGGASADTSSSDGNGAGAVVTGAGGFTDMRRTSLKSKSLGGISSTNSAAAGRSAGGNNAVDQGRVMLQRARSTTLESLDSTADAAAGSGSLTPTAVNKMNEPTNLAKQIDANIDDCSEGDASSDAPGNFSKEAAAALSPARAERKRKKNEKNMKDKRQEGDKEKEGEAESEVRFVVPMTMENLQAVAASHSRPPSSSGAPLPGENNINNNNIGTKEEDEEDKGHVRRIVGMFEPTGESAKSTAATLGAETRDLGDLGDLRADAASGADVDGDGNGNAGVGGGFGLQLGSDSSAAEGENLRSALAVEGRRGERGEEGEEPEGARSQLALAESLLDDHVEVEAAGATESSTGSAGASGSARDGGSGGSQLGTTSPKLFSASRSPRSPPFGSFKSNKVEPFSFPDQAPQNDVAGTGVVAAAGEMGDIYQLRDSETNRYNLNSSSNNNFNASRNSSRPSSRSTVAPMPSPVGSSQSLKANDSTRDAEPALTAVSSFHLQGSPQAGGGGGKATAGRELSASTVASTLVAPSTADSTIARKAAGGNPASTAAASASSSASGVNGKRPRNGSNASYSASESEGEIEGEHNEGGGSQNNETAHRPGSVQSSSNASIGTNNLTFHNTKNNNSSSNNNAAAHGKKFSEAQFCPIVRASSYLNAVCICNPPSASSRSAGSAGTFPKVLSASADSTIHVNNIITGEEVSALEGHTDRVISLAVSNYFTPPEEKKGAGASSAPKCVVASGARDEVLRIWDLDTAKCLHSIRAHKSPVWSVAICACRDGSIIAVSGGEGGSLRSWNGKTGKKLNTFKGHTDKILALYILNGASDHPMLISAGADKRIRIWELLTGDHVRQLEGHDNEVHCVVASTFRGISSLIPISGAASAQNKAKNEGNIVIVSGSRDLTVKVWDYTSGFLLFELLGHTSCVYGVTLTKCLTPGIPGVALGTPIIVSCSDDATIKMWNLKNGRLLNSAKWHGVSVRGIASAVLFASDNSSRKGGTVGPHSSPGRVVLATCGWDKTLQMHDLGDALVMKAASCCVIS